MDLKNTTVVLASGSPRRIDMLRADGIEVRDGVVDLSRYQWKEGLYLAML